jgi:hypothetical protein
MRDFIALPDQPSWMLLNVSAVSTAAAEWVNERSSNSKEKPKVHQEKRETIHSTDLPLRVAKARLACAASAPAKAKRAHFIVSRTTFPHLKKESITSTMGFATTVSSAGRIPTVLPTNQRTPLQHMGRFAIIRRRRAPKLVLRGSRSGSLSVFVSVA